MPQQDMRPTTNQNDTPLFAPDGSYVTSVTRPAGAPPEIIQWGTRYFVRRYGAYREATIFVSNEAPR